MFSEYALVVIVVVVSYSTIATSQKNEIIPAKTVMTLFNAKLY